jgi:hypothetical protein
MKNLPLAIARRKRSWRSLQTWMGTATRIVARIPLPSQIPRWAKKGTWRQKGSNKKYYIVIGFAILNVI